VPTRDLVKSIAVPQSKSPKMKKMAEGVTVYAIGTGHVTGTGHQFSEAEVVAALKERLPAILWDEAGKADIGDALAGVASTHFESDRIAEALGRDREVEDWQVGEAIAEAYLIDHHDCEFPWPSSRDVRNPNASPTGADLVGFQKHDETLRFAFGEVKTSGEKKYPPHAVFGRSGLQKQLEQLRDSKQVKDHLVLRYLALRAQKSAWYDKFVTATKRYLANDTDVSLFGVMVRDVEPHKDDLSGRTSALSKACPKSTTIGLRAFYLPDKSISTLATQASSHRKKKP